MKFFDEKKGYGFIQPDDGGVDVFVHFSGIAGEDKYKKLDQGDVVEYELSEGRKGPQASNVTVVRKGEG